MISKKLICTSLTILFCLGYVHSGKATGAVDIQGVLKEAIKDYGSKNGVSITNVDQSKITDIQMAPYEQGCYRRKWDIVAGTNRFILIEPHNTTECQEVQSILKQKFSGVMEEVNKLIRPVGHEYYYQLNNIPGLIYVTKFGQGQTMLDIMKLFLSDPDSNFLKTKQAYYALGQTLAKLHLLGDFDSSTMSSAFTSEKRADIIYYDAAKTSITFINTNSFHPTNLMLIENDIAFVLNRVCYLPLLFFKNISTEMKTDLVSVAEQFIIGYAETMKEKGQQASIPALKDIILKKLELDAQKDCWYAVIHLFPEKYSEMYVQNISYGDVTYLQKVKEAALSYFNSGK
jgi:hypothetical protein